MSTAAVSGNQGSMNPFELVLSKLPDARPVAGSSQKAWKARCPAHADSDPSLSVTLGDQGGALIHCYAGCSPEAVVGALGLTMADLMPPRVTSHGPLNPGVVYATSDEAVAELERRMGPASRTWVYHDECEDAAGLILRWDREGGKEIRPVSRTREGWVLGGMPTPRPLYRLVELLKRREERVYVTEGEKAADAAGTLGLLATTSPHGAQSAAKADWRALAGRDVAILPDNDDAGRRYADDVARILLGLEPPATVRIVALPEIGAGGDLYDWLEHRDEVEPHTLRERLEKLVEAAEEVTRDRCPVTRGTSDQSRVTSDGPRSCVPVLTCVDDVEETAIRWLWPRRVPLGRITMLVGRPGEGKSFLTTDMAARVTRGLPWPDGSDCPDGSVLVISAEDDPRDTIRPRLRAHGADLKRVHLLSMVRRPDSDGREYETMFTLADVEALDAALCSHPDCRLVVIDPIGSFLGGGTDAHRDNDVRSVLVPVTLLAERHNVAVLVVAHRRKSFGPNADDMALGSRAFTAVARAVWHLARDPEHRSRRLLLSGKNNLAPEGGGLAFTIVAEPGGLPAIAWEQDPVDMTADDAMRHENGESAGKSDGRGTEVRGWLREILADGPKAIRQIHAEADDMKYAWRTVERIAHELCVQSTRDPATNVHQWQLETPAAATVAAGH